MRHSVNPRLLAYYRLASQVASGFVVAVGLLVLLGWLFDIAALRSILPGLATMKANTALAFVLAGVSLWLAHTRRENQRIYLIARACAILTALIGLLTLSEYVFSWDLRIDQLLFRDALTPESAHPGRMSPVTALNFSLLSISLLLLDRSQYRRLMEAFTIIALIISVLALLGYAYGVPSLYQFFPYVSVAIHTALTFAILCLGILFARPEQGLMRIFSSDDPGGGMARRLMPAALALPFLLGWLFLAGERMGLYDSTFRLVLFATSTVIIFAFLIWWNAGLLQRVEVERGQAEEALSLTEQRSRALIENSWDAIALFGADGTVLYGSPSTVQILGYPLNEFVGRNAFELIHEEDQALVTERMTLSLQQPGAHIPVYARVRHKNGEWRWLEGVFTNLLDEPSVHAIVNNYHDFTERKQAEEMIRGSEERFRLIVEAAPSAMIAADREGRINLANVRAQELFGYPEEELLGRPIEMLVPERFRGGHGNHRQRFLAEPTSRPMGAGRDLFGLHKDGHEVPIEIGLTPYKSSEGLFTLALIVDITERKLMEETRAQLAAIVESSDEAIIGKTLDGIITSWNEGAERVYGYVAAEVVGRPISILIPPDLIDELPAILNRMRMGESINHYETARLRKDGQRINVSLTLSPIRDSAGNISGASTIARDITERKRAEEQITYQAYLLENVNDAVIGSDENSIIRFWNQGAERIFGWKAEEVLGRSGAEILRSELLNTNRETVLKILAEQGRWRGEAIFYRKDGSQVIMEVSSITLRDANGPITGYVSVNRDITERKQAEEELRKNAARTQALADISGTLATVHLDYQAVLDAAARRTTELIGDACSIRLVSDDGQWLELASLYHPEPKTLAFLREILGTNPLRTDTGSVAQIIQTGRPMLIPVISPEQLRAIVPATAWSILEHISIHSLLTVPLRAQGGVLGTLTLTRNQPDRPYTSEDEAFLQDLADRAALSIANARLHAAMQELNNGLEQRVVERTSALSQANSLLQMMLDHMPDQIYFKDAQSRFIRNSRSQAKALGLSDPAEAVGKSDFDFFPHAQQSYEKEQEIMRSGKPLVDEEERVVWPDGRETWVSTTKIPLPDESGQIIGTFGISRDITERKRAEVALQKAKLELEAANKELEAFSYSVSHDLRSPLRTIDGFSQALLEDYADQLPAEGQNHLMRVRAATQRMGQLIDDLLNLSRVTRASMKLVPVDLSQLARSIVAELQRTQPERRVNFKITPNLKASGDPGLLRAVLENLLNNAWKFTSKREQAEIEFGSKHENDETVYFIRDNGAGFDMAYADKLFGAFQRLHAMTDFSGTGIGLATVQRIIHRHGGRIWAEGAVDQGATFFFTLPALERAKREAVPQEKESLDKRVKEII
jgi:PAS domain S-box-containing protein